MSETPRPTLDEIADNMELAGGRISIALDEIVRRLRLDLPLAIADVNARLGLRLDKPKEYYLAPVIVTEEYSNTIIVSGAVGAEDFSPGTILDKPQVVVYSLGKKVMTPQDVANAYDRAGVIKGLLHYYLNGCVDPAGRLCWRELVYTGYSLIPKSWEVGGVGITYRMTQPPNMNCWI